MAIFRVSPPGTFDLSQPDSWPRWIRRFERFRQASGLSSKGEESQVNTLIYTMGDKADDILSSFGLSEENQKKYSVVREKFENHFVKRRNVTFERARFNSRKQLQDEAVDSFITDLFCLAEHCAYEQLRDEMIRDRLVVGLRDASLSEKMQLDPELTLDKAMAMARQSEATTRHPNNRTRENRHVELQKSQECKQVAIGVLINKDFPETIQEVHHKTNVLDVGKAQNTVNSSAQQGTACARNVAKRVTTPHVVFPKMYQS